MQSPNVSPVDAWNVRPSITTDPAEATLAGSRFARPRKSATYVVAGESYTSRGAPTCSISPSRITASRSLIVSASSWSCVTYTNVMPTSR